MKDFFRDDFIYKGSFPNHKRNIPTLIPSHTYPENLCPNSFLEKVWLKNTLPSYSLDICSNFRIFFILDPSLIDSGNSMKIGNWESSMVLGFSNQM